MEYFVILVGEHWCSLFPSDCKPSELAGHSRMICDGFDPSGSMIELRKGGVKFLVPHGAVLTAITAPDDKPPFGF
jgi:hypothetical protein